MNIIVIYDDTPQKSEVITDIIGEKGFGDVVVKKRKIEDYYQENILKIYPNAEWKKIHSIFEYADIAKYIKMHSDENVKILHCFSNYIFSDEKTALLSFHKLSFVEDVYRIMDGKKVVALMFPNNKLYLAFCKNIISGQNPLEVAKNVKDHFEIEGVIDIGYIDNFIKCITGNVDSRYFNSLQGNEYTIVKSSTDKDKIKREYSFYHLLPEDMKYWFVMPFNYTETESSASYTMERLYMTDLAIKWVHGSIDESEFVDLMDKYFFFFKSRKSKQCSQKEYENQAKSLFCDKVINRINDLKKLSEYKKIENILKSSIDIDSLVSKYFNLKERIEAKNNYPIESVIGHGDSGFANTLYNKATKTLKFVDPKGALTEEELWTNPYYDIAKLSHSVCGRYDFFNNALFDIYIDEEFSYKLQIPFDNTKYINIFKQKVQENGFDYLTVRLYEASLFLSMLPLHIDYSHKVLGFILNIKNILEEIEKDV